jgi:hypothetical protein
MKGRILELLSSRGYVNELVMELDAHRLDFMSKCTVGVFSPGSAAMQYNLFLNELLQNILKETGLDFRTRVKELELFYPKSDVIKNLGIVYIGMIDSEGKYSPDNCSIM